MAVATNTGAWLPCGTDGKPGYAVDGLVNGPRASRGPGATGCAWRLAIGLWGFAGSYPARGCGACLDAAGDGSVCFSSLGVCQAPPATIDSALSIGAFGLCPASIPLTAAETAAVPTDDTGGAWSQFYTGPVATLPALGIVTVYRIVKLCYSGNTIPPILSACTEQFPDIDYDPSHSCHQNFSGRFIC